MARRSFPHRGSSKNPNWSDQPDPKAQNLTNCLRVKLRPDVPPRPLDVQRSAFIATV
jgi:hypothetical protein